MFHNYIKTAIRNILRYKGFAFINILSLTIGIIGCLLIGLFVWDELQYDRFPNGNSVYRIYNQRNTEGGLTRSAMVPPAFAPFASQQFPEVAATLRVYNLYGKSLVKVGNRSFYEAKGLMAENSFFEFFPLTLKFGSAQKALTEKNTIVLTASTAHKYFGETNPIGKLVTIEKDPFIVTAVLDDLPEHFHLEFNYLISFSSLNVPKERLESWGWQQIFTYLQLRKGTDLKAFEAKFQKAVKAKSDPVTDQSGFRYVPYLQPLKKIHLYSSDFQWDVAKRGDITSVRALTVIAIFVLVIACFNFINLATARSFRRAKEIGVRKVIGAARPQLILQFTSETILLSVFSMLMAGVITMALIPALNNFTSKTIEFNLLTKPLLVVGLIIAGAIIGGLAGVYPALVLSGFQPVAVLKGARLRTGSSGQQVFRQGLVVLQFTMSALLIICTLIVYRQVNYLHQKNLGFSKDQLIVFELRGEAAKRPQALKEAVLQSPNVVSATAGYGLPGDIFAGDEVIIPQENKTFPTTLFLVDEDYLGTMGIELVAGRNFSKDMSTDKDQAFLINETAAKEFNLGSPEAALGKQIHWNRWDQDSANPVKKGQVIGVIRDFHFKSLHDKVGTMVLQLYPEYYKMAVKVKSANAASALADIKTAWNMFVPEPLDFAFMDESFSQMYQAEDRLGTLMLIFAGMAIFIGCMGLFALASVSAEQRVKEIGIRKVLGASVFSITTMLSKQLVRLVLIASMIAFPIAWFAMNSWLQDFSYREPIRWWIFPLATLVALGIAVLTIAYQAIKAAIANPVTSLRSE